MSLCLSRVWPTPPLIHCICLRVIPQSHLFNFTRQTVFWYTSFPYNFSILQVLCFGREQIEGFDKLLMAGQILGKLRNTEQDYIMYYYCTTFRIFFNWAFVPRLQSLEYDAFFPRAHLKSGSLLWTRGPSFGETLHEKIWYFLYIFKMYVKHSKVYIWECNECINLIKHLSLGS